MTDQQTTQQIFAVGDRVRCYGLVWEIVADTPSVVGRRMTPEMAHACIIDGCELLPNGRPVYLDDEDVAALKIAEGDLAISVEQIHAKDSLYPPALKRLRAIIERAAPHGLPDHGDA